MDMEEKPCIEEAAKLEGIIVEEHCLSLVLPKYKCHNGGYGKNSFSFIFNEATSMSAWIRGTKWNLTVTPLKGSYRINLALAMSYEPVNVQIAFFYWHQGKQINVIRNWKKEMKEGHSEQLDTHGEIKPSDGNLHTLIRILDLNEKEFDNPCPPLSDSDSVAIHVGPFSFLVSKHCLMSVSPVFQKMFTVEMKEKAMDAVTLEDVTMSEFREFLLAISPERIHPNPSNVVDLVRLAHRYQVDFLLERCEAHLINCVYIPVMDRLLLAETYQLNKLTDYILNNLTNPELLVGFIYKISKNRRPRPSQD